MEKHTAGPWTISDTSIVTEDHCIAVIEDDGGYEATPEQREANARLIAAAPDLLAACEAALGDYGTINLAAKIAGLHPFTQVPEQLRAAIKLAKGEAE